MRHERISCSLTIDEIEPNVLIIKPFYLQDFQSDSIYEFKLPKIYSVDGDCIEAQKIKYISAPSLAYADIKDIRAKLGDIDITDEIILYHIREASRLAEVIVAKAYSKQNITFSKEDLMELRGSVESMRNEHWVIWEFVVLKAVYECLSSLYITMATKPDKVKEVLSDLAKEFSYNLSAIKDLLDRLKRAYEDIIEQIYTITDPVWGLRGKYAMPINPNVAAPYHGLNGMQGYNRSYASGFAAGHPQYIGRGGRW